MTDQSPQEPTSDLFDWDELKAQIREAIRAAIQECADERGLTRDEFLVWFLKRA